MKPIVYFFLFLPPLLALVFIGFRWIFWRYKNSFHETIAVQIQPPKGLSILECGILLDDALNIKDISLEFLNLYFKGLLHRKDDDSYVVNVEANSVAVASLTSGQKLLLETMMGNSGEKVFFTNQKAFNDSQERTRGTRRRVNAEDADLDYREYLDDLSGRLKDLRLQIYDKLTAEGYFPRSPFDQRKPYFGVGGVLAAGPTLFNIFLFVKSPVYIPIPWTLVLGLAVAGFLVAYSAIFMVNKTGKGQKAKAYVLGLKEYIQTAEIDRIKFILENDIVAYRGLLPYAGLFNAFEKWMKPLAHVDSQIIAAECEEVKSTASALDVDAVITEKSRWLTAFFDLFWYGTAIIDQWAKRKKGMTKDQVSSKHQAPNSKNV